MFMNAMNLRPGQELREFDVFRDGEHKTASGRVTSNDRERLGTIKAILAAARPEEKERWRQLEHPVSHKLIQQGVPPFEVRPGIPSCAGVGGILSKPCPIMWAISDSGRFIIVMSGVMCDGKAYQCSKAAVYFTCEPESVTNHRKNDCNNAERRTKGSFPEGLQSQQRTAERGIVRASRTAQRQKIPRAGNPQEIHSVCPGGIPGCADGCIPLVLGDARPRGKERHPFPGSFGD